MKASIDLDIGGTFTDCYLEAGDKFSYSKSPTTGYDLSVGFMNAIKAAAQEVDLPLREVIEHTNLIRYSTTVAMNNLIERRGPKLGFITTEGFEDITLIGKGAQWDDGASVLERLDMSLSVKPEPIIPREMIVGVKERVDHDGKILRPLDEDDFRDKLQYLVDNGARGFVVCLLWCFKNPEHELRIKSIIEEEYPDIYLGSMPVILSSEVNPKRFEYPRAMTTILNAYLHQSMAESLNGIGDEFRDLGYEKSMLMVHNTGGMAEVFKTAAINTYNGGPVAGIIGSAHIANLYGIKNVFTSDMGGTSFDIGTVIEGSTRFYQFKPVLDRWMVNATMLESKSIGAGGGSIASVNPLFANRIEVGPQSAGSMPGPACYDKGGELPTVTDADVVLGYINAENFHGGKMHLDKEKAREAIEAHIAKPLGIDVEEAAYAVKKVVDGNMGNAIFKETALRGYDPRDFVLFSFGGGGPAHCCGYNLLAGMPKIITFPYSGIFCAFASSRMDITHFYEQSNYLALLTPGEGKYFEDYDEFNQVVLNLQEKAIRDARGEGLNPDDLVFGLELEMKYGGQLNVKRTVSPRIFLENEDDVRSLIEAFNKEYSEAYSPIGVYPEGGVTIEGFMLRATLPLKKPEFKKYPLKGESSKAAILGKRPAYWPELGGMKETTIYDIGLLECGNIIEGPAIIEAPDTTCVIPEAHKFSIDEYWNGIFEKI